MNFVVVTYDKNYLITVQYKKPSDRSFLGHFLWMMNYKKYSALSSSSLQYCFICQYYFFFFGLLVTEIFNITVLFSSNDPSDRDHQPKNVVAPLKNYLPSTLKQVF